MGIFIKADQKGTDCMFSQSNFSTINVKKKVCSEGNTKLNHPIHAFCSYLPHLCVSFEFIHQVMDYFSLRIIQSNPLYVQKKLAGLPLSN